MLLASQEELPDSLTEELEAYKVMLDELRVTGNATEPAHAG
jgi:hypothetical protein